MEKSETISGTINVGNKSIKYTSHPKKKQSSKYRGRYHSPMPLCRRQNPHGAVLVKSGDVELLMPLTDVQEDARVFATESDAISYSRRLYSQTAVIKSYVTRGYHLQSEKLSSRYFVVVAGMHPAAARDCHCVTASECQCGVLFLA